MKQVFKNYTLYKDADVLDFLSDNKDTQPLLKILADNKDVKFVTQFYLGEMGNNPRYYALVKYKDGKLDLLESTNKKNLVEEFRKDLPFLKMSTEEKESVISKIKAL